jgi:hypothetical protein
MAKKKREDDNVSPLEREEAVLRVLAGEDLPKIADEVGVSTGCLTGWRTAFVKAGRKALGVRSARAGSWPSVELSKENVYQAMRETLRVATLYHETDGFNGVAFDAREHHRALLDRLVPEALSHWDRLPLRRTRRNGSEVIRVSDFRSHAAMTEVEAAFQKFKEAAKGEGKAEAKRQLVRSIHFALILLGKHKEPAQDWWEMLERKLGEGDLSGDTRHRAGVLIGNLGGRSSTKLYPVAKLVDELVPSGPDDAPERILLARRILEKEVNSVHISFHEIRKLTLKLIHLPEELADTGLGSKLEPKAQPSKPLDPTIPPHLQDLWNRMLALQDHQKIENNEADPEHPKIENNEANREQIAELARYLLNPHAEIGKRLAEFPSAHELPLAGDDDIPTRINTHPKVIQSPVKTPKADHQKQK